MRKIYLFVLFFEGFIFFLNVNVCAQSNIAKDGFKIHVDSDGKFTTFEDTNRIIYNNISPRDSENKIVSVRSIKVKFNQDRKNIEKDIFNDGQRNQIKKYKPFAIVYICSETKKIIALSFVFRNINESDMGEINTVQLAQYRDRLKNELEVTELSFERKVAKHGVVKQSFKVFF